MLLFDARGGSTNMGQVWQQATEHAARGGLALYIVTGYGGRPYGRLLALSASRLTAAAIECAAQPWIHAEGSLFSLALTCRPLDLAMRLCRRDDAA